MKVGTRVHVTFVRPEGDVREDATICRVTKAMLPMPAGYVPVRFAADGGTLLIHSRYLSEVAT